MREIDRLISAYIDQSLSDEEMDALAAWIMEDRANAITFVRAVSIHAGISDWVHARTDGSLISELETDKADRDASDTWFDMLALIDAGQSPPIVQVEPPETDPPSVRVAPPPAIEQPHHEKVFGFAGVSLYRHSASVGTGIRLKRLGWAAVLGIVATLMWIVFSPEDTGPVAELALEAEPTVATLASVVDARWDLSVSEGVETQWQTGDSMSAGRLMLVEGMARLSLESGASVVIEAPSDLRLLDANSIELISGKVVAHVPEQATGFFVETSSAKVIDLGTEFGVEVRGDGAVSTAVFEGETIVAERRNSEDAEAREVPLSAGWQIDINQAGEIDRDVRRFDPVLIDKQYARRVLKRIDLVDVVAGGDGTNENIDAGIDMMTGAFTEDSLDGRPNTDWRYDEPPIGWVPVSGSDLIDGVFTPLEQSVKIDSSGSIYDRLEAKTRQRRYGFGPLWAGSSLPMTLHDLRNKPVLPFKRWGYEAADRSLLLMHAPKGITFDLHALSESHRGLSPNRLTALVYNAGNDIREDPNRTDPRIAEAGFFVLIDGRFAFQKRSVLGGAEPLSLDLPIPEGARFLTLITDLGPGQAHEFDWVVIGQPTIEMIPVDD